MRDFKKSRGRHAQYLRMVVGLGVMAGLLLVALGTARAAWDMYSKFSQAAAADAGAQQELAQVKAQYAAVSTTVSELETSRGTDAAVRERWGYGLHGEGEIDIIREATDTAAAAAAPQGFWGGLFNTLFGWL